MAQTQNIKAIRLETCLPDEECDLLQGNFLGEDSFDLLVEEDVNVYKPNGDLLLAFRKGAIPNSVCKEAWLALREAAAWTNNRGVAAGIAKDTGGRPAYVKLDGTVSRTRYAPDVQSGIVGYFDRYVRFPYCRTTAYTADFPHRFAAAVPFIQEVNSAFQYSVPERYAAQARVAAETHPDWVIPETVFTTVTVNRNWQTAVHKDAGDLKEGFGVLTALRAGQYEGCFLCFPKYRVAVDMRTSDVLMSDVHEWHGNTPLKGRKGRYERISCVFYYRQNMIYCGSSDEELERAKRRQVGDPLNEKPEGRVRSRKDPSLNDSPPNTGD
jgi:hypothetical protein